MSTILCVIIGKTYGTSSSSTSFARASSTLEHDGSGFTSSEKLLEHERSTEHIWHVSHRNFWLTAHGSEGRKAQEACSCGTELVESCDLRCICAHDNPTENLSSKTYSSGNTTHYICCSCGQLVDERLANGHKHSYVFDSLGSVVGVTDPIGTQLVDTYSYDPTGNILTQTGTVPNNWQYAGGYFNQNTGLTKFGTRYYDPTLGRWTQQDPVGGSLGNPDSLNRYLYAGDDPVNVTDPSGKYTFAQWYSVVGACLASSVIAPLLALAGLITGAGTVGFAIAAIAGVTAPAWLYWVTLIGASLLFGVVLGCVAFATFGYHY